MADYQLLHEPPGFGKPRGHLTNFSDVSEHHAKFLAANHVETMELMNKWPVAHDAILVCVTTGEEWVYSDYWEKL